MWSRTIDAMRTYRLALLAGIAFFAMRVTAHAADITPPNLTAQSTVQDTDLLLTWRNPGPLKKLNASVLAGYVQSKYAGTWLQTSNNLSDLASVTSARTNLGLGTAALVNTGTSGANVPLLNGANTWGGVQTFGVKPFLSTSTTGGASVNCPNGVAPTTPVTGDLWCVSGGIFYYDGTTTHQNAWLDSSITGNAATATKLATARTLAITGDLTWTSPSFDGSGNVTAAGTLATVNGSPGSCGDSLTVCQATTNGKGLVTAQSAVSIATVVGDSGSGGTKGLVPAPAAGTSRRVLTGGGSFQPAGACAFVQWSWNGISLTQGNAYNASVTRTTTGIFFVTFSVALPNANYAVAGVAQRPNTNDGIFVTIANGTTPTTAGFTVGVSSNSATNIDPSIASVIVFCT